MDVSKVKVKLRRRPDDGIEMTLRGIVKLDDGVDLTYDTIHRIIDTMIDKARTIPFEKGPVNCERLSRNSDPHGYLQIEFLDEGLLKVKLHQIVGTGFPTYDDMLTTLGISMFEKIGHPKGDEDDK